MYSNTLTIGDVSKILRVHPNTLRNWERRGILVPNRNKNNNYRHYTQDQVKSFLLRGNSPKFHLSFGYESSMKERYNELEAVRRSIDVCVSSSVSTTHNKSFERKMYELNAEAAQRGVKIRFIRDLSNPIQKSRANDQKKYGIETRDYQMEGMTFSIIDNKLVRLELPGDNPEYRLNIKIYDKEVAKTFSLLFEVLWNK